MEIGEDNSEIPDQLGAATGTSQTPRNSKNPKINLPTPEPESMWDGFLQNLSNPSWLAPVNWFKNAPFSRKWDKMARENLIVELPHPYADRLASRKGEKIYALGQIKTYAGYYALVEYIKIPGDPQNSQFSWVLYLNNEVKPLGFCRSNNILIHPMRPTRLPNAELATAVIDLLNSVVFKEGEPMKHLEKNLLQKLDREIKSAWRFKLHDYVEVLDKTHQGFHILGTVTCCVGNRICVKYVRTAKPTSGSISEDDGEERSVSYANGDNCGKDTNNDVSNGEIANGDIADNDSKNDEDHDVYEGNDEDEDKDIFWYTQTSPSVHNPGFSMEVGCPLREAAAIDEVFVADLSNHQDFPKYPKGYKIPSNLVFEIRHPIRPYKIVPGHCLQVLKHGYIRAATDWTSGSEYCEVIVHITCDYIMEPGFCKKNKIELSVTENWKNNDFWKAVERDNKDVFFVPPAVKRRPNPFR